jgi:hypothetical protein
MWSSISARLAEAIVGLLVAGIVMALLVAGLGPHAGPALALAVAAASIAGVMWIASLLRRRGRRF